MCALFRVNGVSIDYSRLKATKRFETSYKGKAMMGIKKI